MITLRFTYNPTFYNRVIKAYTWYEYTHVDVVIPNFYKNQGLYCGAVPGAGVCYHMNHAEKQKFMTLDVPADPVFDFLASQISKPYDYFGVFSIGLHRNWQEPDKWFCSELVAAAINNSEPRFSIEARKITPRDVAMICKDK